MTKTKWTGVFALFPIVSAAVIALCVRASFLAFARSEIVLRPASPSAMASPGLAVGAVIWGGFLLLTCVFCAMAWRGELSRPKGILLFCCVTAAALAVFTGLSLRAYASDYLLTERQPYFTEITLKELDGLSDRAYDGLVYIQRDGCPLCDEARPELEAYLESANRSMAAYNTNWDRTDHYNDMRSVLEKHGVTSVPAVIVLEHGATVAVLQYADLLNGSVADYLK